MVLPKKKKKKPWILSSSGERFIEVFSKGILGGTVNIRQVMIRLMYTSGFEKRDSQKQVDLVTSWMLVREQEEPGITAGGLLCGPGLGGTISWVRKDYQSCSGGPGHFCWIWWYPADAGGQMGRHVSQFKGLDRLQWIGPARWAQRATVPWKRTKGSVHVMNKWRQWRRGWRLRSPSEIREMERFVFQSQKKKPQKWLPMRWSREVK